MKNDKPKKTHTKKPGGYGVNPRTGQLLQTMRDARGLSQGAVGERSGCSRSTICKIEGGYAVTLETLRGILTRGVGLEQESQDFRRCVALYMQERSGVDWSGDEVGRSLSEREGEERADTAGWSSRALRALDKMGEGERDAVLWLVEQPGAAELARAVRGLR